MLFTRFGFSVKVGGLDTNMVQTKQFGNKYKREMYKITVLELLEPVVDIFEETYHTMIIADMPGLAEEDIHVDLKGDILLISADNDEKKYQKEILLKKSFSKDRMEYSYMNGILKISLME